MTRIRLSTVTICTKSIESRLSAYWSKDLKQGKGFDPYRISTLNSDHLDSHYLWTRRLVEEKNPSPIFSTLKYPKQGKGLTHLQNDISFIIMRTSNKMEYILYDEVLKSGKTKSVLDIQNYLYCTFSPRQTFNFISIWSVNLRLCPIGL